MSLDEVFAHFESYDVESYEVMSCTGSEPGADDVAAFEETVGFGLPDEFREFTMSPLGGLYIEVREAHWPRPRELDVGAFWSFLYGIKVFGIAKDIPGWLDIRVQYRQMVESGVTGLVPFLQRVNDADRFCFDAAGRIVDWSHEEPDERRLVDSTFTELLMQEIRDLEIRRLCKMNHEDPQEYRERVEGRVFVTSKVKVFLERRPASLKTLLLIKDALGLNVSLGELKQTAGSAPCEIAEGLTYIQAIHACEKVAAQDDCLGIRLARDESRRLPTDRGGMEQVIRE